MEPATTFSSNQEIAKGAKLSLEESQGRFFFSPWKHPAARVLKLNNILEYLNHVPRGGTVLDYGSGDKPYETLLRVL